MHLSLCGGQHQDKMPEKKQKLNMEDRLRELASASKSKENFEDQLRELASEEPGNNWKKRLNDAIDRVAEASVRYRTLRRAERNEEEYLSEAVKICLESKDYDGKDIKDAFPSQAAEALAYIADAHYRTERKEKAKLLIETALEIAEKDKRELIKPHGFHAVAPVQAKIFSFEDVKVTAEKSKGAYDLDYTYWKVVNSYLEEERFDEAIKAASLIGDSYDKYYAYYRIASKLYETGKIEKAKINLRRAEECMNNIKYLNVKKLKAKALANIGSLKKLMGLEDWLEDFTNAEMQAFMLKNEDIKYRSLLFIDIAEAYLRCKIKKRAIEMASNAADLILNKEFYHIDLYPYKDLANLYIKLDVVDEVEKIIKKIEEEKKYASEFIQSDLASYHARNNDFEKAESRIQNIQDERVISRAYNDLGLVKIELKDPYSAHLYLEKAVKAAKEIVSSKFDIAKLIADVAVTYHKIIEGIAKEAMQDKGF